MNPFQNICRDCNHTAMQHVSNSDKYPNSHWFYGCKQNGCECYGFVAKYKWESDIADPVLDTDYQNDCLCPHCGYAVRDVWEYNLQEDDLNEITCGSCEKDFFCEFIVHREFSTRKTEKQ